MTCGVGSTWLYQLRAVSGLRVCLNDVSEFILMWSRLD